MAKIRIKQGSNEIYLLVTWRLTCAPDGLLWLTIRDRDSKRLLQRWLPGLVPDKGDVWPAVRYNDPAVNQDKLKDKGPVE